MRTCSFLQRPALALAALVVAACGARVTVDGGDGGVSSGGSDGGVAYDACTTATDCAWGEIDHEILSSSDCVCLLGCPSFPLSQATVNRRQMQYDALCTPGKDGMGNPCPVDDCAGPGPIACTGGHCVAESIPNPGG